MGEGYHQGEGDPHYHLHYSFTLTCESPSVSAPPEPLTHAASPELIHPEQEQVRHGVGLLLLEERQASGHELDGERGILRDLLRRSVVRIYGSTGGIATHTFARCRDTARIRS